MASQEGVAAILSTGAARNLPTREGIAPDTQKSTSFVVFLLIRQTPQ